MVVTLFDVDSISIYRCAALEEVKARDVEGIRLLVTEVDLALYIPSFPARIPAGRVFGMTSNFCRGSANLS